MPQRPLAPPSLRERVGGRWAISRSAYGIALLLLAVLTLIQGIGARVDAFGATTSQLAQFAVTAVAIVAYLAIADRTIFRHRRTRPVPIWWVFALSASLSVLRLTIAFGFTRASGELPTTADIVLSFIAAVAWSSLILPLIAYVNATREWYAQERARLIDLAAAKEAQRMRAVGALDALRDVALVAVQRDVDRARTVLERDDSRPDEVATALLAAARSSVRPAAHSLMDRPPRTHPRASIRAALRAELRNRPLPVLFPIIVFPLLIFPRIFIIHGPLGAVISASIGAAAIALLFPLGRRLITRHPRHVTTLTLATTAAATLPIIVVLNTVFVLRAPLLIWPLLAAALLTLVIITKMTRAIDRGSEAALRELQEPVRTAEIERLAAEQARDALLREIGEHLHSSVQPGLVAASYAIQDAVAREDPVALEEAIAMARTTLARRISPETNVATGDPRDRIAAEWRGLLHIEWDLPDGDPPNDPRIADTIRECLANAVVHGHASTARIRISRDGFDVEIEVEDDGVGPRGGAPGMGAAVLNESTGGRWRLEQGTFGGAILRARVAMA